MPTFHHVNLGVLPQDADAEGDFLVDILGYERVGDEELPKGVGARWFRADDGSEVHLSSDPEHRAAALAHVAIAYGPALGEVRDRLQAAGTDFKSYDPAGLPSIVFCRDPAGNSWELRGTSSP